MEEKLSLGRRLAFGAVVAGIVLLCVEGMLQAYYYATAGAFLFERTGYAIHEPDPTRCYRLKPNLEYEMRTNEFATTIYTNAQGFRTDARRLPVSREKPPDVYRVLFLGPSFAFGWGSDWEQSYAALIAERLRVPGKRVELINLGTPAQGQEPQLCWLGEEGYRFAPDLVVTTIYGTELGPVPASCPAQLECPYVDAAGRLYSQRPTLPRRVIAIAKNFATVFYGYYLVMALTPASRDADAGIGKELYSESERPGGRSLDAVADDYVEYVREVKSIVGERTEVAFIHIPLSFVVHPADAARWWHITSASPPEARSQIEAGMQALRERGLPVVDTTPALFAHADAGRLYYWLDIHLTPTGNRIVAEAAVPVLQALAEGRAPGQSGEATIPARRGPASTGGSAGAAREPSKAATASRSGSTGGVAPGRAARPAAMSPPMAIPSTSPRNAARSSQPRWEPDSGISPSRLASPRGSSPGKRSVSRLRPLIGGPPRWT